MKANIYILIIALFVIPFSTLATEHYAIEPAEKEQNEKSKNSDKDDENGEKADSSKTEKNSYEDILKDALTDSGMFNLHRVKTDLYFEIPDSLFGRDLLIVNKISGVPSQLNDSGINKGMGFQEQIVRFHKDTLYKKVWVTTFDPAVNSPEGDAITQSVKDNYRESVIEYFTIETYNKDSTSVVIKANKVFDGREKSFNNVFGILGLMTSAKRDLSRIESAKSFPRNIVVKSFLSVLISEGGIDVPLTLDITTNIVLLDKEPMKPRFGDDRIGLFTKRHIYFNDHQQKVEERELVNRWRLEPKEEDIERYKQGELVEPKKPIVLYVDPATPPVWVPYIIEGVKDWQVAFEAAGFKNAITAKEVDPETDIDFDIDDVRYSVITYAASEKSNAMGPSVIDPRSGEIIEADIIWWHNVMDLLHAWIRLQTGTVDPNARGNELPTELMGNAVRFVSSHELGHSLGMAHNFGASYSIPVDSLRSKTFTDQNGTASSIMDYARFNYVAQPDDGVTQLTPQIGAYDKFAIKWGYHWTDLSPYEELPALNKMLREKENDKRYWYGKQTGEGIDPRAQMEDLGDDAIKAGQYGIANLKRMMPHVEEWTFESGKMYYDAGAFLNAIISQWRTYAGHVMTNVGGIYIDNIVYGQDKEAYTPVPKEYQKESVRFLINEMLTIPQWLFADPVWNKTLAQRDSPIGIMSYSPYNLARSILNYTYYHLFSEERLLRMFDTEVMLGRENTYTPEEMFNDITKAIFESKGRKSLNIYERASQKNYVDGLIVSSNATMEKTNKNSFSNLNGCDLMIRYPEVDLKQLMLERERGVTVTHNYDFLRRTSETTSVKRAEMRRILKIVKKRSKSGDVATQNHYQDLELRLKEALNLK